MCNKMKEMLCLLVFIIGQCVATTTIAERVWVVERYFRLQGTDPDRNTPGFRTVAREFEAKFGHGLGHMAISRIVAKFKETGSVHNQPHERVAPAMAELDISAAESINDVPTLSLRRRAATLGVSQSSLQRWQRWPPTLVYARRGSSPLCPCTSRST
jgi:hypothetical protein